MGTETAELTPGLYRTIVAVVDERMGEIKVTREDFDRLEAAMSSLAEAQARTDQTVEKLAEAQARTDQTVERLVQAQARNEGRVTRLEAAVERLEAAVERLAEAQARTEERVTGLEAAMEKLAEAQARTEDALRQLTRAQTRFGRSFQTVLGALEARWGLDTEESFRQGMRAILEDVGLKVERYLVYDHAGKVFDRPDQVEMDVVVRDGKLMIIEIKSSASRADVAIFNRKVNFYQEREGRKAERRLLICPFVEEGARRIAPTMDIEVYTRADDLTGT